MEMQQQRPPSAAATERKHGKVVMTLYAPNDEGDNPRILRLVLDSQDGSVLAAIEDGREDGALERAGFAGCVSGPHFFVTAQEYERVLDSSAKAGPTPT